MDVKSTSSSNDLVPISASGAVLAALHGKEGAGLDIPKPFAEPILLVERMRVAGTTHVEDAEDLVGLLEEGQELRFEREPSNLHDKWAIRVLNEAGAKLGYVPADANQILARLMDAGKRVFGRFSTAELIGRWHKVHMSVYLDD